MDAAPECGILDFPGEGTLHRGAAGRARTSCGSVRATHGRQAVMQQRYSNAVCERLLAIG